MVNAGIESLNVFGGTAYVDVERLAAHRGLDKNRFQNLLMKEKAVALPFEDPVTFAANAAGPLVQALSSQDKDRIELLITCSESGIDFGKSLSTYVHHYLGLNRNCRLFEIKQACYAGTAGFQMACNFIMSQTSPGAKALVVATDISRFVLPDRADPLAQDWSYSELSAGAGASAVLVGENPAVLQIDRGANGYYGYEVMDTCRPLPDTDSGDPDLSLLTYLDCCDQAFREYQRRVPGSDYKRTFDHLVFHTPFGGMVKGAHRTMMRKFAKGTPAEIDADFEKRVRSGLLYCQRVGNIMGGTIFLALASMLDHANLSEASRIGCFSYGSGCCAEFFSGVTTPEGQLAQRRLDINAQLDSRYQLSIEEYEQVLRNNDLVQFGTRNVALQGQAMHPAAQKAAAKERLFLRNIEEFHRKYEWVA